MSDLQELIARNAVMAYNQGFERGEASEQERIIKLLEQARNDCFNNVGWHKYHDDECISLYALSLLKRGTEMTGAGARARQKAKRQEWLKNMPYPGFICKVCKHEDMMHFMWAGYCILENCDCNSMDGIALVKGEQK